MTAERLWSTHVRRELDQLGEAFPGWRFRFDAMSCVWTGTATLDIPDVEGTVTLSAPDPAALAKLIRAQRGQTLVTP